MKLPYSKDEFLDRKQEFISQCVKENISSHWATCNVNNHADVSFLNKKVSQDTLAYLYNQIFFDGHMKRFSLVCMTILSVPEPQKYQFGWFDSNTQMYAKSKGLPTMVERAMGYDFKIRFYSNKMSRSYLIHPKFIIAHLRNFPDSLIISPSHYESINQAMYCFYNFDKDFLI